VSSVSGSARTAHHGSCIIDLVVLRLVVVGLLLSVSSGCAAVQPWERGRLAKPLMQLDPEPESTLLEQHVYQYREGSAGGYGGLGGGCGCN
jgi:hypothetical protein